MLGTAHRIFHPTEASLAFQVALTALSPLPPPKPRLIRSWAKVSPNGGIGIWALFFSSQDDLNTQQITIQKSTLPETNMFTPENGWFEDDPFLLGWKAYFQGRTVSFRECILEL